MYCLKQFSEEAQTVSSSSLFHILITLSLKKCCLSSVRNLFFFNLKEWPLVRSS